MESTSNSYTFSSLSSNANYRIVVKVMDTNGKYSNTYVISEKIENSSNLITFYIDNNVYQAEKEMTWKEWTESIYSNNNYYCVLTIITDKVSAGSKRITYYTEEGYWSTPDPNDKIVENKNYYLVENGEPI